MPNKRKYFDGQRYLVNDGELVIVIANYEPPEGSLYSRYALVQWVETGNYQKIRTDTLLSGSIKNPMKPSVEGVGFVGVGPYPTNDRDMYNSWASMIARCYRKKLKDRYPTYAECYCTEEWKNYQNFCEFYTKDKWRRKGWQLDKDLLVLGNKIYSPETCVFLPPELNTLGLSFETSKSSSGHKNIGTCPASGKWMVSGFSEEAKNRKTTIGRFESLDEAIYWSKIFEVRRYESILQKWDNKIDHRAINAFMERRDRLVEELRLSNRNY